MTYLIKVMVKPSAKRFSIKIENDYLKISIPEKAEKGKANNYMIKKLSKLGIKAKIVKGLKNREKILECDKSIEWFKEMFIK